MNRLVSLIVYYKIFRKTCINILGHTIYAKFIFNVLTLIKMEGKIRQRDDSTATNSITASGSISKESANLITSHAMRLGVYSINLGTKIGQKVHTAHMLILPLIPIIITIGQSTSNLYYSFSDSKEISDVQNQVNIGPTMQHLA